jgi:exportin-5
MRDLMSKPKNSTNSAADSSAVSGSGSENAKKKTLSFVNDDFCGAMLDTSFPRLLKREKILPGTALSLGALELWSEDFDDKSKFSQYRSRLVCLIGIYKVAYYCHTCYVSYLLTGIIPVMEHLLRKFLLY